MSDSDHRTERTPEPVGLSGGLRVCVPTSRKFVHRAFQGAGFEAQDVLTQTTEADLLELEPGPLYRVRERWLRRLVWQDFTDTLVYLNPGLRPVQLTGEYDLLVSYCIEFKDLLHINAIANWKERCARTVCVLDEIWIAHIVQSKPFLRALQQFDHVIIGCEGSVEALSEALERPCHFVPPAVDALRFSPYPDPPARVVDIYSMGRRQEAAHQELLKLASREAKFYIHETMEGSDSLVRDYRHHRHALANIAKRSHCFMVASAKIDAPQETNGQIEVPNRYYEGTMAGAVLVGERLECDAFRRQFEWSDAVIEIRPDGSDTIEVVSELLKRPDQLLEIGRRNAAEALRRHDWVYRWSDILRIAGLEPTPGMQARERHLRELADRVETGLAVPQHPVDAAWAMAATQRARLP